MTLSLLLVAFLGGAASILSPCTLPLLPPFVAFIIASGLHDRRAGSSGLLAMSLVRSIIFMAGVTVVFTLSANPATALGSLVYQNKDLLLRISGMGILAFGVVLWRRQEAKTARRPALYIELSSTLAVGVAFGFVALPCCLGRIVSGIFMTDSSVDRNMLVLLYMAGLGTIFVVAGMLAHAAQRFVIRSDLRTRQAVLAAAILLMLIGLLVISGQWGQYIFQLQKYAVTTKTFPIRLEEWLLQRFGVTM